MMCLFDYPRSNFLSSAFRKGVLCALLCTGSLVCTQHISCAAVNNALEPANSPETDSSRKFEYVLENRADPFVPFITEKAATSKIDMNEIVDNNKEPLTGMQLFEPGQLTLVALMKKKSGDVAMVEDFTGKGYVLLEGTRIGRRGIVDKISSNSVLIKETAVTRAGKEIITQVVMTLKKEGEE